MVALYEILIILLMYTWTKRMIKYHVFSLRMFQGRSGSLTDLSIAGMFLSPQPFLFYQQSFFPEHLTLYLMVLNLWDIECLRGVLR